MKHLIIILSTLLTLPLAAEVKDYTSKVRNTISAWGGTNSYQAGDINCIEYYSTGHFYHGTFSQILTGMPVGVYEAEVYFNASCAAWDCSEICGNGTTGRTHLYLNDAEVDVPIMNVKQITEPTLYVIKDIHVSDGTLYLGARNDREGANWHLIRLKSLRYLGTDARSLYDAQFPMIRQARQALAASTCPSYRELLQQAIAESLLASAYDTPEHLQQLYDNISNAIKESETFENKKATALRTLLTRLGTFQRVWNNGGREVNDTQWDILLPAVIQACEAKDEECDFELIDAARLNLTNATTAATGITTVETAEASSSPIYTPDGRRAGNQYRGILIQQGRKILR